MPSLTPLHETYCQLNLHALTQADVLEGLAQLTTQDWFNAHEAMQIIHREILFKSLGLSHRQSNHLLKHQFVQKLFLYGYDFAEKSGKYFIAPVLRKINFKNPNLKAKPLTPVLEYLVGALNGMMGSYLYQEHNPLALPMLFYDHYGQPQQGELSGRVSLMIHGLCMNHLSWSQGNNPGIGEKLLAQRDHNTVLYLNYNTGRRISANGRTLSWLLEDLLQRNPNIHSIDLIGHSMGGLVARSALFYGKQSLCDWIKKVENLVCIGSPHHGAMLERLGFMLQDRLGRLPLLKRIGRLTEIRSDGIIDLRFGSIRDDDWEHFEVRFGSPEDIRAPAPLPAKLNTFLIAGSIELTKIPSKHFDFIGDYLVSVNSALGEHSNPKYQLEVPDSHKAIFYGLNHMELQYHAHVAEQIVKWLYPSDYHPLKGKIMDIVGHAHFHDPAMYTHPSQYPFEDIVET